MHSHGALPQGQATRASHRVLAFDDIRWICARVQLCTCGVAHSLHRRLMTRFGAIFIRESSCDACSEITLHSSLLFDVLEKVWGKPGKLAKKKKILGNPSRARKLCTAPARSQRTGAKSCPLDTGTAVANCFQDNASYLRAQVCRTWKAT